MKWVFIILGVAIASFVTGVPSKLVSVQLEKKQAEGRREFCRRLSTGDVAGAVEDIPQKDVANLLSHPGHVVECADDGAALPFSGGQIVSDCRHMKQDVRVRWEGGEHARLSFIYSCIPMLNIEYADVERGIASKD